MFEKVKDIEKKYIDLRDQLYDPNISSDPKKSIELQKELSKIEDIYNLYQEYKIVLNEINEAKEIIQDESDDEMIEFGKTQLEDAETKKEKLEEDLKKAMLPKDPNDDKDIFLEIRPAAGGDEAGLFASELMRMYLRYAEIKGWNTEIIEHSQTGIGGLKLAVIKISGDHIYSRLKFESGVHRVQRVPETESGGRVHTSTITVAVLPEVEDVEVNLNMDEVEVETYAASSAGGQHANKNETGVRLHHRPTGLIINAGETRSQVKNKEKAFKILKSKLYQIELEKQQEEVGANRANLVGGGSRSEKIRTYNFPQDRLTDHRIKKSWSNLPGIMNGEELDNIIDDISTENQAQQLAAQEEE